MTRRMDLHAELMKRWEEDFAPIDGDMGREETR